ncbi:fructosamine kinase family protein [Haloglycomyces albus]|uniref:fructosamine kinase family protein n=1 Tax=Haloglycomyces albus TaxID=526067 RepID=UPI00046CA46C|nr:fructosamine kinase family protein [Haloglycomyces albus]
MSTTDSSIPYHLIPELLHHQRLRSTPIKREASATAQRLTFNDGTSVFAKTTNRHREGFMRAEIEGLRWLREASTAIVEVLYGSDDLLVEPWLEEVEPSRAAARSLGRELAAVHRCGAPTFGAPWRGFIGELDMDNTETASLRWSDWYAERRLRPFLRLSQDNGALSSADVAAVEKLLGRIEELAGSEETPARLHGDLWFGNVVWTPNGARLIDPAAHGGHRETDLANLRLWGSTPFVDDIITAYDEEYPLNDGWRERIGIHWLFPLLAHTALFGRSFRGQLMSVVTEYVNAGS